MDIFGSKIFRDWIWIVNRLPTARNEKKNSDIISWSHLLKRQSNSLIKQAGYLDSIPLFIIFNGCERAWCWLILSGSAADSGSRRWADISCTASWAATRGTVFESSLSTQSLFYSKTLSLKPWQSHPLSSLLDKAGTSPKVPEKIISKWIFID